MISIVFISVLIRHALVFNSYMYIETINHIYINRIYLRVNTKECVVPIFVVLTEICTIYLNRVQL
jgi:hypothetical protein